MSNKIVFIEYIDQLINEIDLKFETLTARFKFSNPEPIQEYRLSMIKALECYQRDNLVKIKNDTGELDLSNRVFILDRTILPDIFFVSNRQASEHESLYETALSVQEHAFSILGKLFLFDEDKAPSKDALEFFIKYLLKRYKNLSVDKFCARWLNDAKVVKPYNFAHNEGYNQLLLEFDFLCKPTPVYVNQDFCASLKAVGPFDWKHLGLIKNIKAYLNLKHIDWSLDVNLAVCGGVDEFEQQADPYIDPKPSYLADERFLQTNLRSPTFFNSTIAKVMCKDYNFSLVKKVHISSWIVESLYGPFKYDLRLFPNIETFECNFTLVTIGEDAFVLNLKHLDVSAITDLADATCCLPKLESLSLEKCETNWNLKCPNLKKLTVTCDTINRLAKLSACCPALENVELTCRHWRTGQTWFDFFKHVTKLSVSVGDFDMGVSSLTKLKAIDFFSVNLMTPIFFPYVETAAFTFCRGKCPSFDFNRLTLLNIERSNDIFNKVNFINFINLTNVTLTLEKVKDLGFLKSNTLQKANLYFESSCELPQFELVELPQLKTLILNTNELAVETIKFDLPELVFLWLVVPKSFAPTKDIFENLTNLRDLCLMWHGNVEKVANAPADIFLNVPNLERLHNWEDCGYFNYDGLKNLHYLEKICHGGNKQAKCAHNEPCINLKKYPSLANHKFSAHFKYHYTSSEDEEGFVDDQGNYFVDYYFKHLI